jgi:hypothetical protein
MPTISKSHKVKIPFVFRYIESIGSVDVLQVCRNFEHVKVGEVVNSNMRLDL